MDRTQSILEMMVPMNPIYLPPPSPDGWLAQAKRDIRFLSKLRRNGDCIEFPSKTPLRYGCFVLDHDHTVGAHRWAYQNLVGPIGEGLFVCHHCDNRRCVRPAHLFLGTPADNMRDRDAKGRTARGPRNGAHTRPQKRPRGEHCGSHRLSVQAVQDIRRTYGAGEASQNQLAARYGVTQSTIWRVVHRTIWKDVS